MPWPRDRLRRDASGNYACPDEGSGRDIVTLARGNARGAQASARPHQPRYTGANAELRLRETDLGTITFPGDIVAATTEPIMDPLANWGGQLAGWYRPDVGYVVLNGSKVSQCQDRGGRGINVFETTASRQPVYGATSGPNGTPEMIFTPGNLTRLSRSLGPLFRDGTRLNIFAVARAASSHTGRIAHVQTDTTDEAWIQYDPTGLTLTGQATYTSIDHDGETAVSFLPVGGYGPAWRYMAIYTTQNRIELDASEATSQTKAAQPLITTDRGTLFLGAATDGSHYLDGAIAEVVIVCDTITPAQRARHEAYVASHFGSLPVAP